MYVAHIYSKLDILTYLLPVWYAIEQQPESMRTRISCYTAEVVRIRLLCTLEVAHVIEVRILTIEL